MNLPDFSACIDFRRLREKMGAFQIPALPGVVFERSVIREIVREEPNIQARELKVRLQDNAVIVSDDEITVDEKGLLLYEGRKIAAYIRDQRVSVSWYSRTSGYRYHLCDCGTMRSMLHAGREGRYLATQRSDGLQWTPTVRQPAKQVFPVR